jgi:hypothetical protein
MTPLLLSTILLATPASELRAATTDIQTVAPQLRPTTRYLTLYTIDEGDRPAALQVTSYVLNALSRARSVTQPELITPTLIRFNLTQYAPEPDDLTAWLAAWEQLATHDPYFHLQTEVLSPSPARPVARSPAHSSLNPEPRTLNPRAVTTDGPWLDLTTAASLRNATASTGAILRAASSGPKARSAASTPPSTSSKSTPPATRSAAQSQ